MADYEETVEKAREAWSIWADVSRVRDTNTYRNDRREAASTPLLKLELLGDCDYLSCSPKLVLVSIFCLQ